MTVSALGTSRVVADVRDMSRTDWLALRRTGIGGSDAAAICGQSKYKSALEVWLDKTGGLPDEQPDNERMFWGRVLEPIVADVLAERTGVQLTEVGAMLAHPEHEWMLASVDRAADADPPADLIEGLEGIGLAEIKTAGYFAGQDWADDKVPDSHALQGTHYLAVTGLPWVLFGCLIGGQRLAVRVVQRDEELIRLLLDREAEFWQQVVERRPPPPDGSKSTTELLACLWDVKPGAVVTLDPAEVDPLIEMRTLAADAEKAAGYHKTEADNRLRWLIGEHEEAIDPDGRKLFTWRPNKNGVRTLRVPKRKAT